MKFICITNMGGNNEETLININEIAAIKEFFEEDELKSTISLKNGTEFKVEESASDIFTAMQKADTTIADSVLV